MKARMGKLGPLSAFSPTLLSTWTCLVADRPLAEDESSDFGRRMTQGGGRQQLRDQLLQLKDDFKFSAARFLGDLRDQPQYLGGGGGGGISPSAATGSMLSPFRRLRMGDLLEKKLNGDLVTQTFLRIFLCFRGKAKITVSSITGFHDEPSQVVSSLDAVWLTESQIADRLFKIAYGELEDPPQRAFVRRAAVYEVPSFRIFDASEIQSLEELKRPEAGGHFKGRLLERLEGYFPGSEHDLSLLLGASSYKELAANAELYPIPDPLGPCLLAVHHNHDIYGLCSAEPWDACLHGVVNELLFRE